MSKLNNTKKVEDGDSSSHDPLNDVEATIVDSESEMLRKQTEIIVQQFVARLVLESTRKEEEMIEEKGNKDCLAEEDYVIKKKQKDNNVIEKKEKKDNNVIEKKKKKKPKTGDNGKKKQKEKKNDQKDPNIEKFIEMGLEPPPDMPQWFKDCIQNLGGIEIKLIIQKFIQVTDLKSSQNRLAMSLKQVRNNEFLNEEEKEQLNKAKPKAIEVKFVEPCGEVSKLNLNRWDIGASPSYVLNGAWHKSVVNSRNNLKPKDVVQIWSFRFGPNSKLGFAMIKVRDGLVEREEV